MAAPVTGEAIFPKASPDLQFVKNEMESPKSLPENLIASQLSNTPAPFTPSLGRQTSTQIGYAVPPIASRKKNSSSKFKIMRNHSSGGFLRFRKGKFATKGCETPFENPPSVIRAAEIQSRLDAENPSCIKLMVKTHVASCFWMGLPLPFCKNHLPIGNTKMVIEDENGKQYNVKYIAYRYGLSGGWKKYVIEHNLVEGDVLIFHLVEPCKFKVYIIRGHDSKEVDGAIGLLNLDARTNQRTSDNIEMVNAYPKRKRGRPRKLPLNDVQKKLKRTITSSRSEPPSQQSGHPMEHAGSEEVRSEVLEDSRTSKTELLFQEVKTLEESRIMVNGLCVDSELAEDVRMNYYRLCASRKEFLHDALPEGLFFKLVAGMIGQTVSIANEIKNCKSTTPIEEFKVWDNSLKSFELLGMKVGFLRDRIRVLEGLVLESEDGSDRKRLVEAENEQKCIQDEIKKLVTKLVELKESSRKFEGIIETLKQKSENYELKFHEQVNAPW